MDFFSRPPQVRGSLERSAQFSGTRPCSLSSSILRGGAQIFRDRFTQMRFDFGPNNIRQDESLLFPFWV